MQPGVLARHVGNLLLLVAIAMLVPAAYAWLARETTAGTAFLLSAALTAALGGALRVRTRDEELSIRTALAVVVLGWAAAATASALPFWLSGLPWIDALFEAVSGVTTTGATVIRDLSRHDRALLLWRSMLQWFGGLGIIVLFTSVFPRLGIGAIQLFRAEMTGLQPEKLLPRLSDTSKLLWTIYGLLTAAAAVLLVLAGMPVFDAVNHALTTVSTGGFSTHNAGISAFGSAAVESVLLLFMFLGATNFMLIYRVFRFGDWRAARDEEFRLYVALVVGGGLLIAAALWLQQGDPLGAALRRGLFQAVAVISTTGFAVADYTQWPHLAQAVLFVLMFVGGCAGSTAGGPKIVRVLVALKHGAGEIVRVLHPRSVRVVRLDDQPLPPSVFAAATAFLFVYAGTWFFSTVVLAALGLPLPDAAVAAISALGNIGPGFANIGPTETFAGFPAGVKLYLMVLMLVGRLEVLGVYALLLPGFWDLRPGRRVRG